MKAYLATIMLFVGLLATTSYADITIGPHSTLKFATVEQGREVVTVKDEYFLTMTEFSKSAHLQTNRTVTVDEISNLYGDAVIPWQEPDKARIVSVMNDVTNHLLTLNLALPDMVLISKTTGEEEAGAAYTRSNCIYISAGMLDYDDYLLRKVVCHELFHILSRANPHSHDSMYETIGFRKCVAPKLPVELENRIISNPDALTMNHCIGVRVGTNDFHAIPLMYSPEDNYNIERGGNYLSYMHVDYLLVELDRESLETAVLYRDGQPRLVNAAHMRGFYEQIGRNTGYILHPEEILAENFAFLIMKKYDVATPRILRKLREMLPRNPQERKQ